jgi:DNA-binding MarR family transcriptional regulator
MLFCQQSSYEVVLHLWWTLGHRMRVRREPCPKDRRGAYAILTEAGFDRLGEADPTHLAGVPKLLFEHFAEEERKTMAEYWRRVLGGA